MQTYTTQDYMILLHVAHNIFYNKCKRYVERTKQGSPFRVMMVVRIEFITRIGFRLFI